MYYVSKKMEIAAAHHLNLSYESKCGSPHGHNWIVTVHCQAEKLNKDGMVVDFADIKKNIHAVLDHSYMNDVLLVKGCRRINPTAENIAKWRWEHIPECYKVKVKESKSKKFDELFDED